MKNVARPLWLSACCLAAGVAAAAVFQPAPEAARPAAPPAAGPASEDRARFVYGMGGVGLYTYRLIKPKAGKLRERRLMRTPITNPEPIPPMRVRYAVVSLTARETPKDRAAGDGHEAFRIWSDIFQRGIDVPLDRDAKEVLEALRGRYPLGGFRLDFMGEVIPEPDGTWGAEHRGRGVNGCDIVLAHEGAIFDAGLLATGERVVVAERSGAISWTNGGGGNGDGTQSLSAGRTYAVSNTGRGGNNRPDSHLFLICLVPAWSGAGRPRVPEEVYLPPGISDAELRQTDGAGKTDPDVPQPAGAPPSRPATP